MNFKTQFDDTINFKIIVDNKGAVYTHSKDDKSLTTRTNVSEVGQLVFGWEVLS